MQLMTILTLLQHQSHSLNTHTVSISENGTMYCDYCSFKAKGLFCVHIVCVTDMIFEANGEKFVHFIVVQDVFLSQ